MSCKVRLEGRGQVVKIREIEVEGRGIILEIENEGSIYLNKGATKNIDSLELKVEEQVKLQDLVSEAKVMISTNWLELSGKIDLRKGGIEIFYNDGGSAEKLNTEKLKILYANQIQIKGNQNNNEYVSFKGNIYANKLDIKGIHNLKIDQGNYYIGKSHIEIIRDIDIVGKVKGMEAVIIGSTVHFKEKSKWETENVLDKKKNEVKEGGDIRIEVKKFTCNKESELISVRYLSIKSKEEVIHDCITKARNGVKINAVNNTSLESNSYIEVESGNIVVYGENEVNIEGIILSKKESVLVGYEDYSNKYVRVKGIIGAGKNIWIKSGNEFEIKEVKENLKDKWKKISSKWVVYESDEPQSANIISKEGKIKIECERYKGENEEIVNYRKEIIEEEYGIEFNIKKGLEQKGVNIKSVTGIKYSANTDYKALIVIEGTIGKGGYFIRDIGHTKIGEN